MKSKTFIISLVVVVAIIGGAFALAPRSSKNQTLPVQQAASPLSDLGAQSPEASPTIPPTAAPTVLPAASPVASSAEGPVHEISVTARQFTFDPSVIRVKKGERVRINLTAADVSHSIAIPELGVDIAAAQGGSASGEFTPNKTGTFDFYCSVFCGSGHADMKGQLIVEE